MLKPVMWVAVQVHIQRSKIQMDLGSMGFMKDYLSLHYTKI